MLLQVVYTDNHYDYVKDFMLDDLIESRKIAKFRRRSGWVTIGVDPIRARNGKRTFNGIERRSSVSSQYPIDIKVI
jgi:hypothetical protein